MFLRHSYKWILTRNWNVKKYDLIILKMLGNVLWCRNAGICSRCAHLVMLQDGLRGLEIVRFIICCYRGTFSLPDLVLSSFSFFRPYCQTFSAKIFSWVSCSCLSNLHMLHLTDQLLHKYDLSFATVNSKNDWVGEKLGNREVQGRGWYFSAVLWEGAVLPWP